MAESNNNESNLLPSRNQQHSQPASDFCIAVEKIKKLRQEFTGSPLEISAECWFKDAKDMTLSIWPNGSVQEHVHLMLIGAPSKIVKEVHFHEHPTLATIKETLDLFYPAYERILFVDECLGKHTLFAEAESDEEVFLIANSAFDILGNGTPAALRVFRALAAHYYSLLTKNGLNITSLDTSNLKYAKDVQALKGLVKTARKRESVNYCIQDLA
ncbi:hypothetical protein GGF42_002774 [Coemansia sp. RSA 2424]|nr:hypothetical protein GGF42_002774 [Coemansia sp. RSA 2424]